MTGLRSSVGQLIPKRVRAIHPTPLDVYYTANNAGPLIPNWRRIKGRKDREGVLALQANLVVWREAFCRALESPQGCSPINARVVFTNYVDVEVYFNYICDGVVVVESTMLGLINNPFEFFEYMDDAVNTLIDPNSTPSDEWKFFCKQVEGKKLSVPRRFVQTFRLLLQFVPGVTFAAATTDAKLRII